MSGSIEYSEEDGPAWIRDGDEFGLVEANKYDAGAWTWQVGVGMAEFIREEPLESEMRRGVEAALRSVPGVTEVAEEDREVWIVQGDADGRELVRAVARLVDSLTDRARAHLDDL